jgi:hypothetical protein
LNATQIPSMKIFPEGIGMYKSFIGAIVCLWAWRSLHGRGAGLTFKDGGGRNAIKKADSLTSDPIITWDFSYMVPYNDSQNSVMRRLERS